MSQDPVEIVRRMFEAFARRDLDAMVAEADPGIEVRPAVVGGLEGTVYRGHAGLRAFVADVDEAWREFRVQGEEFRLIGDDEVLVLARHLVSGMKSGLELDTAAGYLLEVRGGRVHRVRTFASWEATLDAAGLEGPDPPPT